MVTIMWSCDFLNSTGLFNVKCDRERAGRGMYELSKGWRGCAVTSFRGLPSNLRYAGYQQFNISRMS